MYSIEIPTPIEKLEKARKAIEIAEKKYNQVIEGLNQYDPKISERSTILCKKCGKRSQIKNVIFSRYYWYESPHGCMGGACWHSNGFVVACPKCGKWEHFRKPTKSLPNYDLQKVEFRIVEKLLRFAQQCGDVRYSDGEYNFTHEIEWKHE